MRPHGPPQAPAPKQPQSLPGVTCGRQEPGGRLLAVAICSLWEPNDALEWVTPPSVRKGSWQANLEMGEHW